MRGKIKVFVASLDINDHNVDPDRICKYCQSSHRTELVAQQLKHSQGSELFLLNDQREIINIASEFCNENNFKLEIVDFANLNFFEKMKLAFRGIKAPLIYFEGKVITGKPTKEDLKTLTNIT
ncbi:MAG: hypothetical protein PVF96_06680 [Candidatus Bathyarchaeota archaeon]